MGGRGEANNVLAKHRKAEWDRGCSPQGGGDTSSGGED